MEWLNIIQDQRFRFLVTSTLTQDRGHWRSEGQTRFFANKSVQNCRKSKS